MSPFASRALPKEDFSWAVVFIKGLRDALLLALPVAAAVLVGAIGGVVEPDKLGELGVPVYAVPIIIGAFASLRNFLRVRLGWPVVVAFLALLSASTPARAQGVGETLQGLLDPHVVAGAAFNPDTKTVQPLLTANIVGVKLGEIPCYAGGVGVSLSTLVPGLEGSSIASASIPYLTCAPFGEQIAVQVGMAIPIGGGASTGNTYYAGLGISISGGPNQLKAKRVKRIQAKEAARKRAEVAGPPAPQS